MHATKTDQPKDTSPVPSSWAGIVSSPADKPLPTYGVFREMNTELKKQPKTKKTSKPKPSGSPMLFDFIKVKPSTKAKFKAQKKTLTKESKVVIALDKLESQGLRQKGVRGKKKLTVLKKRVLKERRFRSYLLNPSSHPCPLQITPVALGYKLIAGDQYKLEAELYHPVYFNCRAEEGIPCVKNASVESVGKVVGKGDAEFRDYVTQGFSCELENAVIGMVKKLFELQKRQMLRDPMKAKQRRRLVIGMREVFKGVRLRKTQCVILAANVELGMQGLAKGANTMVVSIIKACEGDISMGMRPIPVIFTPSRARLGKAVGKHVSISALGVYSFDGANEEYKDVVKQANELKDLWERLVSEEAASKECVRCSKCNRMVQHMYYYCRSCIDRFCPNCSQSNTDRKTPCRNQLDSVVPCDRIGISRSVPLGSDNVKEERTVVEEAESKKTNMEKFVLAAPFVPFKKGLSVNAKEFTPR